MVNPVYYKDEKLKDINIRENSYRGVLRGVSTADLHFGNISNPEMQYNILKEQMIDRLYGTQIDFFAIAGDLFDYKLMTTSDALMYAIRFISDLVDCARIMKFTILIIEGTLSHDAMQLKLFYNHMLDTTIDMRIVEKIGFEYIKGAKVLCIPEEYGMSKSYYDNFLNEYYDLVIMHGEIKGAIYSGNKKPSTSKAPVFVIDDFRNCKTCIISGHVHTPGCHNGFFYYTGSPIHSCFGEDVDKGFLVSLHDLDTGGHYVHFEQIISPRYVTVNLDDMICCEAKDIINHIKELQVNDGISHVRVEFLVVPSEAQVANLELIKTYFKNNINIKLKFEKDQKNKQDEIANNILLEKYADFDFILDTGLSKEEILCMYINKKKEFEYIKVDELIKILEECN